MIGEIFFLVLWFFARLKIHDLKEDMAAIRQRVVDLERVNYKYPAPTSANIRAAADHILRRDK
jgi:hypothetical protein